MSLGTLTAALPLGIALFTAPSLAQASIANATEICSYDPDSGVPNVLGMRAYITAAQVGNDTVFVYEQFASPILNENNSDILTDVKSQRTLTVYGTPIDEARQVLVNSPKSYAALVGAEQASPEDPGFEPVNNTLVCQATDNIASAPVPSTETPETETPEAQAPPATATPAPPQATIEDLPNGSYRFASASYPPIVISDAELVENGGTLFLFRKFGEEVTGRFSYIDSDIGACVTGKVDGNTITGEAYTDDDGIYPEESTAIFLGPGGYLQLGENDGSEPRTGERNYDEATLSLESFSRINAGSVLPPESCP